MFLLVCPRLDAESHAGWCRVAPVLAYFLVHITLPVPWLLGFPDWQWKPRPHHCCCWGLEQGQTQGLDSAEPVTYSIYTDLLNDWPPEWLTWIPTETYWKEGGGALKRLSKSECKNSELKYLDRKENVLQKFQRVKIRKQLYLKIFC